MKKFIVACAAVSAITAAAGMSAMAAEYNAENNSVAITVPAEAAADTQKTILVIPQDKETSVTDADIYYINQDADLGTTALLKGDSLADGTYVVKIGYYKADGTFAIANDSFTVGNDSPSDTHEVLMGDVTGDSKINNADAQQVLRYEIKGSAGFASDPDKLIAADINADSKINNVDSQQILRYAIKGETKTNVGKTAVVNADGTVKEYK